MKKKETELPADMPMDDFFAELDRKHNAPWPKRLWYFRGYYLHWPWNTIKDKYYSLLAFFQRGKHGWAPCDTWNMDYYLAHLLGEMLTYLTTHQHGYPYPFYDQEHGSEAWDTYLKELAEAFQGYTNYMDSDACRTDMGNVLYKELIEKMRSLFDHYSALGD